MTATDDRQAGDLLGGEAVVAYRPDLDPANAGVRSWVYLICLDPPIEHTEIGPHAGAAHYTGSADDLRARLAKHGTSEGARLLQVQRERGGSWHLARTWPGGKYEERAIKEWKQGPRLCPDCTPGTQRGSLADLARATERVRAEQARRYAAAEAEIVPDGDEVLLGHEARGREDAARFLAWLDGASADEIEAAAAEAQGPYYEGDRTPEGDARQGAFAEVITAAIDELRETERAQTAAAAQPQEGTPEVSTGIAQQPAGPEAQPATEWQKGAQAAHDVIVRQVEAGQSADHIAGKWEEALATYDDATATDAEREWHAGAEETAADMIQTWREMERAEAEQAQAAKDARDAGKTCDCDYPACRSGELPSALQEPGRPEAQQPAARREERQAGPEPELEAEAG